MALTKHQFKSRALAYLGIHKTTYNLLKLNLFTIDVAAIVCSPLHFDLSGDDVPADRCGCGSGSGCGCGGSGRVVN